MQELRDLLFLVGLADNENIYEEPTYEEPSYDYLENGERILTLARKKKRSSAFKTDSLTVRLCDMNFPALDPNLQSALNQIERTIKKEIKKHLKNADSEEYLKQISIPFLLQFCPQTEALEISIAEDSFEKGLAEAVTNSEIILKVTIQSIIHYVPVEPKKRFSDNAYYYRECKHRKINMYHADTLFYQLFLIRWLCEMKTISKIDESIKNMLCQIASKYSQTLLQYDWSTENLPQWMNQFLLMQGFTHGTTGYLKRPNSQVGHRNPMSYLDFINYSDSRFQLLSFVFGTNELPLKDFIMFDEDYVKFFVPYEILYLGLESLHHIVSNLQDIRIEEKHRKQLEGMVARAYTTKRNIPNHILHEMRTSDLNEYFGFVELDEDVDLNLVDSVIEEFKRLNHHIFSGYKNKNIALRFRKLGRHHATGLYYPSISTMVVDFRYPASFIHEYFHMLDDENGNLSMDYSFSKIANRYTFLLKETIKQEKENNRSIQLSGKYNLNYYLRKCEIFARCGEIHLFRNLHVKSSLLKPEETQYFCYPDDEELNHLIDEYFSNLLKNLADDNSNRRKSHYEENLYIANH